MLKKFPVVVVVWYRVIIVSALSLSLRGKERFRDWEIERAWQLTNFSSLWILSVKKGAGIWSQYTKKRPLESIIYWFCEIVLCNNRNKSLKIIYSFELYRLFHPWGLIQYYVIPRITQEHQFHDWCTDNLCFLR